MSKEQRTWACCMVVLAMSAPLGAFGQPVPPIGQPQTPTELPQDPVGVPDAQQPVDQPQPTASPPATQAQVQRLQEQLEELRAEVEERQTETAEQNESMLQDLERRAVFSGIMSHYLRIPQSDYPYVRAFAVILLFNAQIAPRLRFYGEVEFEDASAIGEGAGALELEQGFGELILWPELGFRLGVVLVPFGKFNRRHEEWRQSFSVRPLANFLIFPSTYADAGALAFGTLARSESMQLSYEVAVVNGLDDEVVTELGGTGLRDARPAFARDNNAGKSVVGRLGLAIGEHLELGTSGYWGDYTDHEFEPQASLTMMGADLEVTYPRWSARLEAVHVLIEESFALVDDDEDPTTPQVQAEYPSSMSGVSAEAELQFWPSFLSSTPLGEFSDPVLFLAGRGDFGRLAFRDAADQKQIVLSASFGYRPVARSALRFEFARGFKPDENAGIGTRDWGKDLWLASVSFALGF